MGLFDFLQPKGWSQRKREQQDEMVVSDQEGMPFVTRNLLSGTYISGRRLELAYCAYNHGWTAYDFHSRCDNKGPCVVYAVTEDGYR